MAYFTKHPCPTICLISVHPPLPQQHAEGVWGWGRQSLLLLLGPGACHFCWQHCEGPENGLLLFLGDTQVPCTEMGEFRDRQASGAVRWVESGGGVGNSRVFLLTSSTWSNAMSLAFGGRQAFVATLHWAT